MWEFLIRSLDASTIFTIAALGELIGQRSGILNVGIEGVMLFGATLGFIAAQTTGDPRYRPTPWLRRRALLGKSLLTPEN